MAWREDNRRISNNAQYLKVAGGRSLPTRFRGPGRAIGSDTPNRQRNNSIVFLDNLKVRTFAGREAPLLKRFVSVADDLVFRTHESDIVPNCGAHRLALS